MSRRDIDEFENHRLRAAVEECYSTASPEVRATVDRIGAKWREQYGGHADALFETNESLRARALALVDGGADRSKFDGPI